MFEKEILDEWNIHQTLGLTSNPYAILRELVCEMQCMCMFVIYYFDMVLK